MVNDQSVGVNESRWVHWLLAHAPVCLGDFCSSFSISIDDGCVALWRLKQAGFPLVLPENTCAWGVDTALQVLPIDVVRVERVNEHLRRLLAVQASDLHTSDLQKSVLTYDAIHSVPWVDSTQNWAQADFQRSPPSSCYRPRAVLAEYQTMGRGRLSRVWQAAFGDCLMTTVAVSLPRTTLDQRLSPALGVLLCDWLNKQYRIPVRVKWPNDLLFDDRKLAGILIQSSALARSGGESIQRDTVSVFCGVGLNLHVRHAASKSFARPAIGLFDTGYPLPTKSELAAEMLCVFLRLLDALASREWAFLHEKWPRYDQFQGQNIRLESEHAEAVEGMNGGIDDQGQLRVKTIQGEQIFCVGEVSLRPV
ncbi:MAG: biotin--[acetyl-CoA-carboxylase] ligase [Gammaproteobacteria bacterium]